MRDILYIVPKLLQNLIVILNYGNTELFRNCELPYCLVYVFKDAFIHLYK